MNRLVLALTAGAIACDKAGDPDDLIQRLDQVYQVQSDVALEAPCNDGGEPYFGEPYFRLRETETGLDYFVCRAADDCDDNPDDTQSFSGRSGDAWIAEDNWNFYTDETICTLAWRWDQLNFGDAGAVSIVRETLQTPPFEETLAKCDAFVGQFTPSDDFQGINAKLGARPTCTASREIEAIAAE